MTKTAGHCINCMSPIEDFSDEWLDDLLLPDFDAELCPACESEAGRSLETLEIEQTLGVHLDDYY